MADLQAGLKTERREDGRLNVMHVDDTGKPYVAHVTGTEAVTDADVEAIHKGDRETYPTGKAAWQYTQSLIDDLNQTRNTQSDAMLDDFMEPALHVAHAGLHKEHTTLGSTRIYRENFDKVFGGK